MIEITRYHTAKHFLDTNENYLNKNTIKHAHIIRMLENQKK